MKGFRPGRFKAAMLALSVVAGTAALTVSSSTDAEGAAVLPPGFQETVVFSGLTNPTAVRFAADGRVFVAEKQGTIKVFDSLSDPYPTSSPT